MLVAQVATELGNSGGILGIILGGALLTAIVGAYRFWVNFRTTERGLTRQRIREAHKGQRIASYEAGLWQGRCADLEYLLRKNGIQIPPLSDELKAFINEGDLPMPSVQWDDPSAPGQTGGKQGP